MKLLTIIAAMSATVMLTGCGVNPDQAKATLEAMGMINVQIGDPPFSGCRRGQPYSSTFTAIGVNGKAVSGIVCSDSFNRTTVRFD